MAIKYFVTLTEYERDWGSKVDSIREFSTAEEAMAYYREFNSKNTEEYVPDWYMVASFPVMREV